MSMVIKSKLVLGFPTFAEPKAIGDGKPAYGCRLIIDPSNKAVIKQIKTAIEEVAKEKWGGVDKEGNPLWKKILDKLYRDKCVAYSEVEYVDKNDEPWEGFEGMYHLGCRNSAKKPPELFDAVNEKVTDPREIEKLFYPGSLFYPKVEFWAQDDPEYGRRINCNILGGRFAGNGKRLSGGGDTAKADDFADLDVDEDENLDFM